MYLLWFVLAVHVQGFCVLVVVCACCTCARLLCTCCGVCLLYMFESSVYLLWCVIAVHV